MEKINNLDELMVASLRGMAVFVPGHMIWMKHKPASFMINQPGCILHRLFLKGMFIYHKKEKK